METKVSSHSWKLQASIRKWAGLRQEPKEKDQDYLARYKKQLENTEKLWGVLIPHSMKGKPVAEQEAARRKFLACHMAGGLDRSRHKKGLDEMNNQWLRAFTTVTRMRIFHSCLPFFHSLRAQE